MTHVTCMLTAANRDQLRNPTLGNRVWATFLPRGIIMYDDDDDDEEEEAERACAK